MNYPSYEDLMNSSAAPTDTTSANPYSINP